jgi:serine/threonine-protein kinase
VTVKNSSYDYSVQVKIRPGERRTERITVPRGTLALRIRPYADVFIDGRHVGLTPMPPVSLSPGRHRVRLVNNSLNRSILRTVTVRPGQRASLIVNMADTP